MNSLAHLCITTLMAAASLASLPATASAQQPEVSISGGGMAVFTDMPGGTIFSVQAHVAASGAVSGHFTCLIPGIVVIVGDKLTAATCNADGSVTLRGLAHGVDLIFGVFTDMPFEIRLWPGAALAGRFLYDDPFVGTDKVDTSTEGDHELVTSGHIMINKD